MKVTKVGLLTEHREVLGLEHGRTRPRQFALVALGGLPKDAAAQANAAEYFMPIILGEGERRRRVRLPVWIPYTVLESQLTRATNFFGTEPFNHDDTEYEALFVFKNQLFVVATPVVDAASFEEASLQVEKLVYSRENRLKRLRQEVSAMQRAESFTGPQRTAIPEAVRLLVWIRDGGKCVRCGFSERLHFDHVIPVAKGGGNTEQNIQILCERCNLQKSDRIAF